MDVIYWSHTEDDIRTRVKLLLGIERAKSLEIFQSFAYVVNAALGGGKPDKPLQNEMEAMSSFAGIFGRAATTNTGDKDPFAGLDATFAKLDNINGNRET